MPLVEGLTAPIAGVLSKAVKKSMLAVSTF
jgi:hypothetical protein